MKGKMKSISTKWTLVVILCICKDQVCFGQPRSFRGDGSHLISQPLSAESVLLRFTFQTSAPNSLMLLSDRNGVELSVQLIDGSVVIEDNLKENHTLGRFLNDDVPHTLTIYHNSINLRFIYQLDNLDSEINSYPSGHTLVFGAQGFYFGGPLMEMKYPPFAGCLRDIFYGDGNNQSLTVSLISSSLQQLPVTESEGGTFGSCDQCDGVNCGQGRCVVNWLLSSALCDCRNSTMVGESCSLDADISITAFPTQNGSYICYTPTYTPNLRPVGRTSPGNTFTVQLLPPIPSDGTIATAFASNGYFSLRMSQGELIYKYNNLSTLIRTNLLAEYPPIVISIDDLNQPHQIDLTVDDQVAILTLTTLISPSLSTGNSTVRSSVTTDNMVQEFVYSSVCLGGSLVDVENYRGRFRRALFNYHSLLEERNACQLNSSRKLFSDFVRIKIPALVPSFALETVTLRSHHISFDFRVLDGRSIFWIVNGSDHLFVSSVTDNTVVLLFIGVNPTFINLPEITDEWHRFSIGLTENDGIHVSIDGVTVSDFSNNTANFDLSSLLDAPVHFGSRGDELGVFTGTGLLGCMANFNFQGSSSVVPNLDALVILDELAYDTNRSQCFHCTDELSCPAGQICEDRGQNVPRTCAVSSTAPDTAIAMNCTDLPTYPPRPTTLSTIPTLPTVSTVRRTSLPPPSATPNTSSIQTTQTTPTATAATGRSISPIIASLIGIAVTVVLVIAICLVIAIIICRMRISGQGFYHTNETSDQEMSLPHVNTSLKEQSADSVGMDHAYNNNDYSMKNGNSKGPSSYSNGGPPAHFTSKSNSKHSSRDKEYYM